MKYDRRTRCSRTNPRGTHRGPSTTQELQPGSPPLHRQIELGLTEGKEGMSSGPRTKAWSRTGDEDNDDALMAALDHWRPGFGRLCGLWQRARRGCSCRGCGGGSWWLFVPWLRRRELAAVLAVAAAAEVRGRGGRDTRLAAVVPRGSRVVVGEAGGRRGGVSERIGASRERVRR